MDRNMLWLVILSPSGIQAENEAKEEQFQQKACDNKMWQKCWVKKRNVHLSHFVSPMFWMKALDVWCQRGIVLWKLTQSRIEHHIPCRSSASSSSSSSKSQRHSDYLPFQVCHVV